MLATLARLSPSTNSMRKGSGSGVKAFDISLACLPEDSYRPGTYQQDLQPRNHRRRCLSHLLLAP
jgi:hypothetical protein